MSFAEILGQENALAILRSTLRHGRLSHAYLFVGPEGVGKRLCALTLLKALNCRSLRPEGDPCEACPSCSKINSSNHADVTVLEPEGEFIKIDQIRELQKGLRFHPLEGGARGCIIDGADRMNEAASNAILKTLEEPPEATHFFLISARPHQLRPTILSRCQWVKFKALSIPVIERILREKHSLAEETARFCASLAGGSAAKALALSNRVDFQKRLEWLRIFSETPQKSAEEIIATCERIAKEKEELDDLLELWKVWVRDLLVYKIGGGKGREPLINHDLLSQAGPEAGKYSLERLDSLFGSISETQKALAMNANSQLALENLLLGMRRGGEEGSGRPCGTTLMRKDRIPVGYLEPPGGF